MAHFHLNLWKDEICEENSMSNLQTKSSKKPHASKIRRF